MEGEYSEKEYENFGYYSDRPEKSAIAIRREQEAIAAFDKAHEDMEARIDLVAGETEVIELLNPKCHLTPATLKSFREHVKSFPGWKVRRRKTTEEERLHFVPELKRKCYFINVLYTRPRKDD